ncbi:MAG: GGDEF domain-containing protein [Aquabacterium sp.]|uniref:GGDEF domain-containing protein n=1 Tax=Aquabacterium sp. TaxID=1872578 RepID=UPI002720C920|nr:GGDEF domain-containing protein [Aquabacterium sp.]MDO9006404.1 GGDEF domain-containing protein [Aquabacterium sp.]
MKSPSWQTPLIDWALGQKQPTRRYVLLVLATLQLYAVTIGILLHSVHLGLLDRHVAHWLILCGAITFLTVLALVRSGWSLRLKDPILAFPHALASNAICVLAFMQLGDHRSNVLIIICQTIVAAMFRLKPARVLLLGALTVGMLAVATIALTWHDPIHYPVTKSWAILAVGGSTLLMLSLVGKWISDIGVKLGRQTRELTEAVRTVEQMATTDMLTGLLNRRVITDLAEAELKLMERTGAPMCVALIDLDHFKDINDRFGHHAGDTALRGFAQSTTPQLRQVDKLARWGGEEFLLMLPQLNQHEALTALERLRQTVEALVFKDHALMQLTFSVGIAQAQPGESLEHLVDRADQAVYEAKRQGRNRCVLAASPSASAEPMAETLA